MYNMCVHVLYNHFIVIVVKILSELLDEDKLQRVPLLVFANKQDLRHSSNAQQVNLCNT